MCAQYFDKSERRASDRRSFSDRRGPMERRKGSGYFERFPLVLDLRTSQRRIGPRRHQTDRRGH